MLWQREIGHAGGRTMIIQSDGSIAKTVSFLCKPARNRFGLRSASHIASIERAGKRYVGGALDESAAVGEEGEGMGSAAELE